MHVETRYFLIFQNILGSTKNFRNQMDFFSSSAKYYFLQKVGTFIETFILTWSSLASNIFSKKSFCFLINLKFKKVVTSLLASLALSKKQNFRCIQAHSWTGSRFSHNRFGWLLLEIIL